MSYVHRAGIGGQLEGTEGRDVLESVPSGICWESLKAPRDMSLGYFIAGSRTKRADVLEGCGGCVVGRRLQTDVGGEPREHRFGNLGLWGLHIPGRGRGLRSPQMLSRGGSGLRIIYPLTSLGS